MQRGVSILSFGRLGDYRGDRTRPGVPIDSRVLTLQKEGGQRRRGWTYHKECVHEDQRPPLHGSVTRVRPTAHSRCVGCGYTTCWCCPPMAPPPCALGSGVGCGFALVGTIGNGGRVAKLAFTNFMSYGLAAGLPPPPPVVCVETNDALLLTLLYGPPCWDDAVEPALGGGGRCGEEGGCGGGGSGDWEREGLAEEETEDDGGGGRRGARPPAPVGR